MGSFSINVDKNTKIFYAEVEGTFSPEDGMKSLNAYKEAVSSITVPEYAIDIDCTKLNVSAPDALPLLEANFQQFKNDGFHQVTFRIAKNPILKMQLSRVARMVQMDKYEIIEQ
ncbi:hypothetical protein [Paenibacillus physcomitrellae]|uniref:STAS domain-containing protein n=1 Tax=Paenibacillus physcomitrellae TaxID=1619311 RepID=A0ABQ1G6G2_9BACL|nr:hypothetical protein [Paenibacillus physcomitrellae]GGA37685.1 hypothetical protein GCM10010917_23580 [Paenibacillus physcomitrellae]